MLHSKLHHICRDPSVSEDLTRAKAEPHKALPKLVQDADTLFGAKGRETWALAGGGASLTARHADRLVCTQTGTAARIAQDCNTGDPH